MKIQRGIFQGNMLSPLLFVIAMRPPNHILRKCTGGYKLTKSQGKLPNVLGRHQTVCWNEKELETLIQVVRIYSQDTGTEFVNNEKRKKRNFLQFKLCSRNLIKGMNIWVVSPCTLNRPGEWDTKFSGILRYKQII